MGVQLLAYFHPHVVHLSLAVQLILAVPLAHSAPVGVEDAVEGGHLVRLHDLMQKTKEFFANNFLFMCIGVTKIRIFAQCRTTILQRHHQSDNEKKLKNKKI